MGISYGDSVDTAREKILAILASDSRTITDEPAREPKVVVNELADSSVNLKVSAWVASADYWGLYHTINERIYNELPEAGINFPFPQLQIHNS